MVNACTGLNIALNFECSTISSVSKNNWDILMKILKAMMLCVCLIGISQVSYALPIVQTDACVNDAAFQCATGVTRVGVLGTLYDVIFSQDSYDNIFSSSTPTFLGDVAGAEGAGLALVNALNRASVAGISGRNGNNFSNFLLVPFRVRSAGAFGIVTSASSANSRGAFFVSAPMGLKTDLILSRNNPSQYNAFAVFTPSNAHVPAPATLALFGLGLAGLGWSRRKKA